MSKYIIYILLLTSVEIFSSNVMFLEPVNISLLNSENNDFAPSWNEFDASLYYASNRTGKEKIYYTSKNADGFFETGTYLEAPLNKHHENLSYIDFLDQEKAYFSTFIQKERQPILQIFYSNFKKQTWSEGFEVTEFKSGKFTGQSSISPDLNQIVYVSQSEAGDLDLFISYKLEDGSWKEPIELDFMNSIGNEITPYFSANDTLYFASDGQGGPGGYDIYFSIKAEGIWQRPSPLYEINTEYDESDVCILPNGDLIFASNRPGGKGGLDLWLASNSNTPISLKIESPLEINLQSYITNITTTNNFEYKNLPITSTFYLSDSTMILPDKLFVHSSLSDMQKINSVEESYYNSLNYIGYKMNKNPNSKLKITAYYPGKLEIDTTSNKNSKYYADLNIKKIYDFLTNKYNIAESQLVYSYDFYKDDTQKPAIVLTSSNSELFSELEIRNDNITIEQKFLPIDVRITPDRNLSHWLAIVNLEGIENIVYENTKSKDRFTLDLTKYKDRIFDFDNFVIKIKAFSMSGDSVEKTIPHNIEHRFTKKPKLEPENGKHIEYHYLYANATEGGESIVYSAILDKVYNSMTMCKSIEVMYNKRTHLAKQIKDKLQSKIMNNQIEVQINKFDDYTTNELLDDNLVIIKIGKYPTNSSSNN